jgi:hypothetical protein
MFDNRKHYGVPFFGLLSISIVSVCLKAFFNPAFGGTPLSIDLSFALVRQCVAHRWQAVRYQQQNETLQIGLTDIPESICTPDLNGYHIYVSVQQPISQM